MSGGVGGAEERGQHVVLRHRMTGGRHSRTMEDGEGTAGRQGDPRTRAQAHDTDRGQRAQEGPGTRLMAQEGPDKDERA